MLKSKTHVHPFHVSLYLEKKIHNVKRKYVLVY